MKRILLLILISVHCVWAQANDPIRLSFSMLSWGKTIKDIYYMNQGERIDVTIYNGAPTKQHEVLLAEPLVFYRDGPVNDLGESTPLTVASVDAVSSSPDTMLIFMEDSNAPQTYRIVSVETGARSDGTDVYKLFNMTKYRLAAQLEDERHNLEPGANIVTKAPSLNKPNVGVIFALELKPEQEWKLVYKTQWPFRSGRSTLVFIIEDPKAPGELKVRRVYYQTAQPAS